MNEELKNTYHSLSLYALEQELLKAARQGDLESVKYILLSPELKARPNIDGLYKAGCLIRAASNNHLPIVQWLLTSKEMAEATHIRKFNQEDIDEAFETACENDHIEIVKFLFESPELDITPDIHMNDDSAIISACGNENIEMVKYLLSSPTLKEHANIYAKNSFAFLCAVSLKSYELLNYLIFDYNIIKTEEVIKDKNYSRVEDLFNKRELNSKLHNELSNIQDITKKNKI